jgi:hypothetical protein
MSLVHSLLAVLLFVVLSPGVLLRLPPKGDKWTVALVHGVIFAVLMHFLYMYVLPALEGFKEGSASSDSCIKSGRRRCPAAYKNAGQCVDNIVQDCGKRIK